MKQLAVVFCLVATPALAQGVENWPKPNLSETNIREPPKSNPNAGSPSDYLLIPASTIGKAEQYLRFDVPIKEIRVDNPAVLTAAVGETDQMTVILHPQGYGGTRVVVFGALERNGKNRLLYDATVAVGTRVVTMRRKDNGNNPPEIVREVLDCTPACYPSPTTKPREPDQIIENRNVSVAPLNRGNN